MPDRVATRPARSATRRSVTWGRSAARSRTPTRPPTCRRSWSRSAPRWWCGGRAASRNVAAGDFFKGLFEPDLATDEVLTEIRVPKTAGRGWSYLKFHRRAQDWALVGVAALAQNGSGPAVALTNMGDRPVRATGVEEALAGGADPAAASQRAAEGTSPPTDAFASAEYRQELVKVLVRRALEEAQSR